MSGYYGLANRYLVSQITKMYVKWLMADLFIALIFQFLFHLSPANYIILFSLAHMQRILIL